MKGFSHLTLRIKNLEASLAFYTDLLGMSLIHLGRQDAYLKWGEAWICLLERENSPQTDNQFGMDHIAFSIDESDFHQLIKKRRIVI